uniref:Uncharacterized protein n=1 Tax=Physcomitrium patens TaxID=3218 RepID=A0A2K1IVI5_PHYPA|nr:hypothetical protein PHYPA_025229 [Physcomitrium patens]
MIQTSSAVAMVAPFGTIRLKTPQILNIHILFPSGSISPASQHLRRKSNSASDLIRAALYLSDRSYCIIHVGFCNEADVVQYCRHVRCSFDDNVLLFTDLWDVQFHSLMFDKSSFFLFFLPLFLFFFFFFCVCS